MQGNCYLKIKSQCISFFHIKGMIYVQFRRTQGRKDTLLSEIIVTSVF